MLTFTEMPKPLEYHKHIERMQSCISLKFSQNCLVFHAKVKSCTKLKLKKVEAWWSLILDVYLGLKINFSWRVENLSMTGV